uniref:Uncharacterized protein n=1 Tax=Romanomermis culicivorax TaxID=13658 RepID=A0A915HJS8_ROMCU
MKTYKSKLVVLHGHVDFEVDITKKVDNHKSITKDDKAAHFSLVWQLVSRRHSWPAFCGPQLRVGCVSHNAIFCAVPENRNGKHSSPQFQTRSYLRDARLFMAEVEKI